MRAQHDQQDTGGELQHGTQCTASTYSGKAHFGRLNGLETERAPQGRSPCEYIDKMSPA